jgi:excisionase family DNA binding protein
MAYQRKTRLFPIALSVGDAARCLGVARKTIETALRNDELKCYAPPSGLVRPRILVADIHRWVTQYWKVV